mmetsp:Transcript_19832/g.36950  ORF Transcript_19832/g.36950 Transcript_19832/m.36950 type:complete len:407 (-) Transcript_19832:99-1319(-)
MSLTVAQRECIKSDLLDSGDTVTQGHICSRYELTPTAASSFLSSLLSESSELTATYVSMSANDGRTVVKLGREGDRVYAVGKSLAMRASSIECGQGGVRPAEMCRKRAIGRQGGRELAATASSGSLKPDDQGLKSNPFGQKRTKVTAEAFFNKPAPAGKSKFATTVVKGPKKEKQISFANSKKQDAKKKGTVQPKAEEEEMTKAQKSKRKVFDEDSEDDDNNDDDGTGFLEVGGGKVSAPEEGACGDDDEFQGDEESDDENEKVKKVKKARKKKDAEADDAGEVVDDDEVFSSPKKKEPVVGAMDSFTKKADSPTQTATIVGGKRKVTKKRYVEREEMDDKGYIHTTTVEEEYEEWEDVTPEKKVKGIEGAMPVRSSMATAELKKKEEAKGKKKQQGLMGFFSKKK